MAECEVRKLIRKICNENCHDWGTCPISKMILEKAVDMFASYDLKQAEAAIARFHRKYGGAGRKHLEVED